MDNPKTSVIDQFLVSSDASSDDYQRFLLSMVYSDAAARAQASGNTDSAAIQAFLEAWASHMGSLGWTFAESGSTLLQSSSSRSRATAPFSKLLAAEASRDVPGSDIGELLLTLLTDPSTQDEQMLDLWWQYASATSGWLSFGFAQLQSDPAGPIFAIGVASLPVSHLESEHGFLREKRPVQITRWQKLGAEVLTGALSFTSRSFKAQLRRDVFDGQAAEVRSALGPKLANHYVIGA